jgi:hypothetical protein
MIIKVKANQTKWQVGQYGNIVNSSILGHTYSFDHNENPTKNTLETKINKNKQKYDKNNKKYKNKKQYG